MGEIVSMITQTGYLLKLVLFVCYVDQSLMTYGKLHMSDTLFFYISKLKFLEFSDLLKKIRI